MIGLPRSCGRATRRAQAATLVAFLCCALTACGESNTRPRDPANSRKPQDDWDEDASVPEAGLLDARVSAPEASPPDASVRARTDRDGAVMQAADASVPLDSGPAGSSDAGALLSPDAADGMAAADAGEAGPYDAGRAVGEDARATGPAEAGTGVNELCPDGFARGKAGGKARLMHKLNPSPEGVGVCPNGDVFAGAGEVLWRVPSGSGSIQRFATLPGRSLEAIVCDARGRIFVADISAGMAMLLGLEPKLPPAIVMLEDDGQKVTELIPHAADVKFGGFNGLIELPGLGLYATDMIAGLVLRFVETSPGKFESSIVMDKLEGANGLAYNPAKKLLYIAQTGMWGAADHVHEAVMHADGTLGAARSILKRQELDGFDGLAIDEHGALYRANQLTGTITRMTDETTVAMVPNPASMAFRGGTLWMTDFKMLGPLQNGGEGGLYTVDLGVCEGPRQ